MQNQRREDAGTRSSIHHSSFCVLHSLPYCCGSNTFAYAGGPSAFFSRAAHTLYSGIFETGSWAAIVSWLALFLPAQWYGMKIVSGRMVVTTCARNVQSPRRVSAVAQSPSA